MKHLIMLFVLSLSIMFTNHYAEGGECETANTTKDMVTCLESRLRTTTNELTKIQKQIEKFLTQEEIGIELVTLRKANTTWMSYRDANCANATSLFEGGSMEPLAFLGCKVRMTEQRIQELRLIYEEVLR